MCSCGKIQPSTENEPVQITPQVSSEASEPENEEAAAMIATEKSQKLFEALAKEFEKCDWDREGYNAAIKAAGKIAEVKGKELFMPIRVKITGSCHGPELVGILDVLGREETISRLTSK